MRDRLQNWSHDAMEKLRFSRSTRRNRFTQNLSHSHQLWEFFSQILCSQNFVEEEEKVYDLKNGVRSWERWQGRSLNLFSMHGLWLRSFMRQVRSKFFIHCRTERFAMLILVHFVLSRANIHIVENTFVFNKQVRRNSNSHRSHKPAQFQQFHSEFII